MNRRRPSLSGSAQEPQPDRAPVRSAFSSPRRFVLAGLPGVAVLSLALASPANAQPRRSQHAASAKPADAPAVVAPAGAESPSGNPSGSTTVVAAPGGPTTVVASPGGPTTVVAPPGGPPTVLAPAPAGSWPEGPAPGFAGEPTARADGGLPGSLAPEQQDPMRAAAYDRYLGPARTVPTNPAGLVVVTGALRGTRVASAGYQPFSDNKSYGEAEVGAGVRVFRDEQKSLFAGAAIGWGTADAHARGAATHLESMRLEVTAQALYAFRRHLLGTARLSVGALQQTARLTGESTVDFSQTRWSPEGSALLGVAARIPASRVDFLISLEGGWVFVSGGDLQLSSSSATTQRTVAPVSLGSLSLGGPAIGLRGALMF